MAAGSSAPELATSVIGVFVAKVRLALDKVQKYSIGNLFVKTKVSNL